MIRRITIMSYKSNIYNLFNSNIIYRYYKYNIIVIMSYIIMLNNKYNITVLHILL